MDSSSKLSHLLDSLELKSLKLKNRVAMAPLTRGRAEPDSRVPNALMKEYYAQRAGAGLIVTEGTAPSKQGNGWVQAPGIYSEAQVEGWKPIVNAVHDQNCAFFLQMWHTGRASHSDFQANGQLPVAPSAIAIEGDSSHSQEGNQALRHVPRALRDPEEIPGIIEDYRKAAENAKKGRLRWR